MLAGCETTNRAGIGATIGALAGTILGRQIGDDNTSAAIGAVVGGTLGYLVGKHMDEQDRQRFSQALNQPEGNTTRWTNDKNGNRYAVTPASAYTENGRRCRGFEQEAVVDGRPTIIQGTACQEADSGRWDITQQA